MAPQWLARCFMASRTTWGLMAVVVALPLSPPRALHMWQRM
jgi:hypothetical protein